MLDADLAGLYGTTTKRLNEQVKRNRRRFPEDFMFQLTKKEKAEVVAICDHLGMGFLFFASRRHVYPPKPLRVGRRYLSSVSPGGT